MSFLSCHAALRSPFLLFSFLIMIPSAISVFNTPTTGSVSFTIISGSNSFVASERARVGVTACKAVFLFSTSSLQCKVHPGIHRSLSVAASANLVLTTFATTATYDGISPSSFRTNNANAQKTGSQSITIFGVNNGINKLTHKLRLGRTATAATNWISETAILVKANAGANNVQTVVVTPLGISTMGSITQAFTFNSPKVSSVIRSNGPSTAGLSMTIIGSNYASTATVTLKTAVGKTSAESSQWVSDSSSFSKYAAAFGDTATVVYVSVSSRSDCLLQGFTFDSCQPSSASPANGAVTGSSSLTLLGRNSGSMDRSVKIRMGGGTGLAATVWVADSSMLGKTALGSEITQGIAATLFLVTKTITSAWSFGALVISSQVAGNGAPTGSTSMTIIGTSLNAVNRTPKLRVKTSAHEASDWISETAVKGKISSGFDSGMSVALTVLAASASSTSGNSRSSLTNAFSYNTWSANSFFRSNLPGTGSVSITMTTGLTVTAPPTYRLRIGGTACFATNWISDTSTRCKGPPGAEILHVNIDLTVAKAVKTIIEAISYRQWVTSVAPVSGPGTGAYSILLIGSRMGPAEKTLHSGRVIGTGAEATRWVADSGTFLKAPAGTDTCNHSLGQLVVLSGINNIRNTLSGVFAYNSGEPSSVTRTNSPQTGSISISLVGANFAVSTDRSPRSRVGKTAPQAFLWTADSAMRAKVAQGMDMNRELVASSGTPPKSLTMAFSYYPVIANAPTTGAISVTISVVTLVIMNTVDSTPHVRVGRTACEAQTWIAQSSVKCKVPAGVGDQYTVIVSALATSGNAKTLVSLTLTATYASPTITAFGAANAAATGSTSITVWGTNFGKADYSMQLRLGVTRFEGSKWRADSSTVGKIETGISTLKSAIATVARTFGTISAVFTFDKIVPSSIRTTNSPPTGAVTITLLAVRNAGQSNYSPKIRIGSTSQESQLWISDTALRTKTASGIGIKLGIMATVGLQSGSTTQLITYVGPTISSAVRVNVIVTGSNTITIIGMHFGSAAYTVTSSIGRTAASSRSSWVSESSTSCKSSSGSAVSQCALVTVGRQMNTATLIFSYDAPLISSSVRVNIVVSGSVSITIIGVHLGGSSSDYTSRGNIGGSVLASSSWISESGIKVKAVDGVGKSPRGLTLTSGYSRLVGSNSILISFDYPNPSSTLRCNSPTTGANTMTFLGLSFGYQDFSTKPRVSGTSGEGYASTSHSSIRLKTSSGMFMSSGRGIVATTGLSKGSMSLAVTVDGPSISSSIRFNIASTGAMSVTVSGFGFVISAKLRAKGTAFPTAVWNSVSTIILKTPSGVFSLIQIVATATQAIGGTSIAMDSYNCPSVSSLLQTNTQSTGANSLTVLGSALGFRQFTTKSRAGGTGMESFTWVSDTHCVGKIAQGSGIHLIDAVSVGIQSGSITTAVTYNTPVVSSVLPSNSQTTGSMSITLLGADFSKVAVTLKARIGMATAAEASKSWSSDTIMACKASRAIGRARSVSATVRIGAGGTFTLALSMHAVAPSSVVRVNVPSTGSVSLTLAGFSAGGVDYSSWSKIGTTVAETSSKWSSDSSIRAKTPAGTGRSSQIAPTAAVLTMGTITLSLTYIAPAITAASNLPVSGATSLTLSGTLLAPQKQSQTGRVGTTGCEGAGSWISDSSLFCKVSASVAARLPSMITGGGFVSSRTCAFTTDNPRPTSPTPVNVATTGAQSLTVYGSQRFGMLSYSPFCRTGRTRVESAKWQSDTQCIIKSSQGVGFSTSLSFTTAIQVGTMLNGFSFNAPIISSASRSNGPSTSTMSITIMGVGMALTAYTSQLRLGQSAAGGHSWTSDTMIAAKYSAGIGRDKIVAATSGAGVVGGTVSLQFSFDNPAPSSTITSNIPTTGSISMTTLGFFVAGKTDYSSWTRVGSTSGQVTTSWTSTSGICLKLGFGVGQLLSLASSLASKSVGTLSLAATFLGPKLTALRPVNSAVTGANSLTMLGRLFGVHANSSPSARLGAGTACMDLGRWYSESSILCKVPSDASKNLLGTLAISILSSFVGSLTKAFSKDSAVISSLVPVNGATTSSMSLTLSGANMLSRALPSTVASLSGTASTATGWVSDSSTVVKIPSGLGTKAFSSTAFVLTTSPVLRTTTTLFCFDSAIPSSVLPCNLPGSGAISVSITGSRFGGTLSTSGIKAASTGCEASSPWRSDSAVLCKAAAEFGSLSKVVITAAASVSTGTLNFALTYAYFFLLASPFVNSATTGSMSVTIIGPNFGPSDVSTKSRVASSSSQQVLWMSQTCIQLKISSGTGTSRAASASTLKLKSSLSRIITYDQITTSDLCRSNQPKTGAASLSVQGVDFGISNYCPASRVGAGTAFESAAWVASSSIKTKAVSGYSVKGLNIGVSLVRLVSTLTVTSTFDRLSISSTLMSNVPTTHGAHVTVSGQDFGVLPLATSVRAALGGSAGSTAAVAWFSDSSVRIKVSSVIGSMLSMVSSAEFATSTLTRCVSSNAPMASSPVGTNAPMTGSSFVTLTGFCFGIFSLTAMGSRQSRTGFESTYWVCESALLVKAASGSHAPVFITPSIMKQTWSLSKSLSFNSPLGPSSLSAANAPTTGAISLTLFANCVGRTNASPGASVGQSSSEVSNWWSDTSMKLKLTWGSRVLTRSAQISLLSRDYRSRTLTLAATFDATIATMAATLNSPVSGAVTMTVGGINFAPMDTSTFATTGGTGCEVSTWYSSTLLRCKATAGTCTSMSQGVTVGFRTLSSLSLAHTYDALSVQSQQSANYARTGGMAVNMLTRQIGEWSISPAGRVLGSSFMDTRWVSNTAIKARVPASWMLFAAPPAIVATACVGRIASRNNVWSFNKAVVSSVSQSNVASSGSTSVTISGAGFVLLLSSPQSRHGMTASQSAFWVSDSSTTSKVGGLIGGRYSILAMALGISVAAQKKGGGTMTKGNSWDLPQSSSLAVGNGAGSGSYSVTISGSGMTFGMWSVGMVNERMTMTMSSIWTSDSCIRIKAASGSTVQKRLALSAIDGLVFFSGLTTLSLAVTVDSPGASSAIRTNHIASGALSLSMIGNSLGSVAYSSSSRFGITKCESAVWLSGSSLKTKVASGTRNGRSVAATVARQLLVSTLSTSASYDAVAGPLRMSSATPLFASLGNSAVTGSQSLTLTAKNLGTSGFSPTISLKTGCEVKSWASESSIRCKDARGRGEYGVTAHISLANQNSVASTLSNAFTFDLEFIVNNKKPPTNSPLSGSVSVTISGGNFGLSPTGIAGQSRMEATAWTSDSGVRGRVAGGSTGRCGSAVALIITVPTNRVQSCINCHTFNYPALVRVSPPNGPPTGAASLTMLGFMFGTVDASPSVRIRDGTSASSSDTTSWASESAISSRVMKVMYSSSTVLAMTSEHRLGTLSTAFTIDGPVPSSIVRVNGGSTGAVSLTLAGREFEPTDKSPKLQLGGTVCMNSLWVASTSIRCKSPFGISKSLSLVASVLAHKGLLTQVTSFDNPVIYQVQPPFCPTRGQCIIQFKGQNFGYFLASAAQMTMQIGDTPCGNPQNIGSDIVIQCRVPAGAGAGFAVKTTIAGQSAFLSLVFSYSAPTISSVQRVNVATTGSMSVTLCGANFGTNSLTATSHVGSTSSEGGVEWNNDSTARCKAPSSGFSAIAGASVTVYGQIGSMKSAITYSTVVATGAISPNFPRTGSKLVSLLGSSIRTAQNSAGAVVGRSTSSQKQWMSDTSIWCKNIAQTAYWDNVIISVSQFSSTLSTALSWDLPKTTGASPTNMASTGGMIATLYGIGFSPVMDGSVKGKLRASGCESLQWSSESSLKCKIAEGTGMNRGFVISISKLAPSPVPLQLTVSFNVPVIQGMSRGNAPSISSSTLTLSAAGLGTTDSSIVIRLGNSVCVASKWVSDSSIQCRIPVGSSGALSVVVSVIGGRTVSSGFTFDNGISVANPSWSSSSTGSTFVTIQGVGLGNVDLTGKFRVGGTGAASVNWKSDSTILLKVSWGSVMPAQSIVGSLFRVATLAGVFSYPMHSVQSVNPSTNLVNGQVVTVLGNGYGSAAGWSAKARISATACRSTQWTSTTSVTCSVLGSTVRTIATTSMVVTVNQQLATATGMTVQYAAVCGDGMVWPPESCDDANLISGDGCSSSCAVEQPYACLYGNETSRSYCTRCGDGFKLAGSGEVCDDGNTQSGDGCSSLCTVEPHWTCSQPFGSLRDKCYCQDGWFGPACNLYCDVTTCNSHGVCIAFYGSCLCNVDYFESNCNHSTTPTESAQSVATLDQGGSVQLASGQGKFVVPPNAVNSTIDIWIRKYPVSLMSMTNEYGMVFGSEWVYWLGQEGTIFDQPVMVQLESNSSRADPQVLRVYEYSDATKNWSPARIHINVSSNLIVTAYVYHFSKFTVMEPPYFEPRTGLSIIAIVAIIAATLLLFCCVCAYLAMAHRHWWRKWNSKRKYSQAQNNLGDKTDFVSKALPALRPYTPTVLLPMEVPETGPAVLDRNSSGSSNNNNNSKCSSESIDDDDVALPTIPTPLPPLLLPYDGTLVSTKRWEKK